MPLSMQASLAFPSPYQVPSSGCRCCWPLATSWTRPTSEKLKPPSLLSYDQHFISFFSLLVAAPFSLPLCFHIPPQPCGHLFEYYFPFYALRAVIAGVLCSSPLSTPPTTTTRPPGHFFFFGTPSGLCMGRFQRFPARFLVSDSISN